MKLKFWSLFGGASLPSLSHFQSTFYKQNFSKIQRNQPRYCFLSRIAEVNSMYIIVVLILSGLARHVVFDV